MAGGEPVNPVEIEGNPVEIEGITEPGFEPVRDAFAANFALHKELGAAVCVYLRGKPVVDLWGGVAPGSDQGIAHYGPGESAPKYGQDTLQLVFSTTKGMSALCANILVDRGYIDLDAPISDYWPELSAGRNSRAPVIWLLSHRLGLPTVDARMTLEQALTWEPVVSALADQEPFWEPGSAHGYHALTFGWLVGELVRRVTGRSIGELFRDEIAGPLDLDSWIGLPEELEHRVAPLLLAPLELPKGLGSNQIAELAQAFLGPGSLLMRSLTLNGAFGITPEDFPYNRQDVHGAQIPAANGITDARSLAKMYAAVVGEVEGVRLVTPATAKRAATAVAAGSDRVLMVPTVFGAGFMCHCGFSPFLGSESFGHTGAGGSVGFGDLEAQVGFAYVMNQMRMSISGDPRAANLVDALRACLR